MKEKIKYYSLKNILEKNATYNVIIGERSNGKSYASYLYGLEYAWIHNKQFAIIRRRAVDFKGKRAQQMFDGHVSNGVVEKLTKGEWTKVEYTRGGWYWARMNDEGKTEISERPFAFSFSLNDMEHDKSTSYPDVDIVIFDEFISRDSYIPDEFVLFMNVLSTIIRLRTNVKIFMLGNTVNKYCPYFGEMGLTNVKKMQKGTIDIYTYGNSDLTVAVEFSDFPNKDGKPSDFYFAFDNPKLQMITGGVWELDIYPHLPRKYKPEDVQFMFFIKFDNEILQCEIIEQDDCAFIFCHYKTTRLYNEKEDLIYSIEYNPLPNWHRNLYRISTYIEEAIVRLIKLDKIFFQSNDVGEVFRNYSVWCGRDM